MKCFDVLSKREFNNGKEVVRLWHKVGIIKVANNGQWFLQMFHLPNMDYYVFEHDKNEELPEIQVGESD